MLEQHNETSRKALFSRRGLLKIGAGLVAFIPAAQVLLQNGSDVHAASPSPNASQSPDYVVCSKVYCNSANVYCSGGNITFSANCYDYYSGASCGSTHCSSGSRC